MLAEGGTDVLAFETIPALVEAKSALRALDRLPAATQAWISFSCKVTPRNYFIEPCNNRFSEWASDKLRRSLRKGSERSEQSSESYCCWSKLFTQRRNQSIARHSQRPFTRKTLRRLPKCQEHLRVIAYFELKTIYP